VICPAFILLFSGTILTQSPYQTSWKSELIVTGGGAATFGLSQYLKSRVTLFTPEQLERLDHEVLPDFDELAVSNTSWRAGDASDIVLNVSQALPLLFLTAREPRCHFGQVALLYGETVLINAGLTYIVKYTVRKPRPYVYNPDTPAGRIQTVNAQASFVSGHTSATASATFFMARVFADFYPDSPWKPVVWSAAAVVPAVTGYLRVRAGNHYPTDVIGGYILGASVGYLVPFLHRNSHGIPKDLTLSPAPNGIALSWQF
jgi:membrane-associated phospholipid phosphatase